jgi:hypothetical protein
VEHPPTTPAMFADAGKVRNSRGPAATAAPLRQRQQRDAPDALAFEACPCPLARLAWMAKQPPGPPHYEVLVRTAQNGRVIRCCRRHWEAQRRDGRMQARQRAAQRVEGAQHTQRQYGASAQAKEGKLRTKLAAAAGQVEQEGALRLRLERWRAERRGRELELEGQLRAATEDYERAWGRWPAAGTPSTAVGQAPVPSGGDAAAGGGGQKQQSDDLEQPPQGTAGVAELEGADASRAAREVPSTAGGGGGGVAGAAGRALSTAVLVGDGRRVKRLLLAPIIDATQREVRQRRHALAEPAAALQRAQSALNGCRAAEAEAMRARRRAAQLLSRLVRRPLRPFRRPL